MGDNNNYYNEGNMSYVCTAWAPILGFGGIAASVVFASKFLTYDEDRRRLCWINFFAQNN